MLISTSNKPTLMNSQNTQQLPLQISHVCGVMTIILLVQDFHGLNGKIKDFLSFISKREIESSPNILINMNSNWYQSLDNG